MIIVSRAGSSSGACGGGILLFPEALAGQFDVVGVVDEAVEDGIGDGWVPEYLMMPLILIGELVMLRLSTLITPFLGPVYGCRSGFLTVGRPWLCSFFPMDGNDRSRVLQQI
jgi:hypothetical protein